MNVKIKTDFLLLELGTRLNTMPRNKLLMYNKNRWLLSFFISVCICVNKQYVFDT